jgi:hypothetical protein
MWLAQFVCTPQFFKTPKGLGGHRWNSRDRIPDTGFPEFHCNLMQTACGKKNFQSFTVICRKPHVANSICLRATIFQNPEGTLWTHSIYEILIVTVTVRNAMIPWN